MAVAEYNPASRKRYYEANKERSLEYSRIYNLQRKFNLTPEQYLTMEEKQNGVCSICKKKCTRKLAVDHDHSTGKVGHFCATVAIEVLGTLKII